MKTHFDQEYFCPKCIEKVGDELNKMRVRIIKLNDLFNIVIYKTYIE